MLAVSVSKGGSVTATKVASWWFEQFDHHGRLVFDSVTTIIAETQEEYARAQAEITSGNNRAYGQINQDAQGRLRSLAARSESLELRTIKKGAPRVVCVNNKIIVLWRYAKTESVDILSTKFASSEYRAKHFNLPWNEPNVLPFHIDLPTELTDEDRELVEHLRKINDGPDTPPSTMPVVIFAYASDPNGVYKALGAEALLKDNGTLKLHNPHDFTDRLNNSINNDVQTSKGFDQAPRKAFNLRVKTSNEKE